MFFDTEATQYPLVASYDIGIEFPLSFRVTVPSLTGVLSYA